MLTVHSTRSSAGRIAIVVLMLVLLATALPAASAAPSAGPVAQQSAVTCTYRASFLGDVTVPDNTVFSPGAAFVKTWRLRNDGNCAWGPGTTVDALGFVGGNSMGSPTTVPLAVTVNPGQAANLSISLIAPGAAGVHRGDWKLRRTNGTTFGVGGLGNPFYVQIRVAAAAGPERINFASGGTTASRQGRVTFGGQREYVLRALAGQEMTVAIVSPRNIANFAVTGLTDGQPYKRLVNEDRFFTFTLPATQDYQISVATPGDPVEYVLSVAVAPLP